MTNVLLTGAGFSRNWGGWLANEAFEFLLGRPAINPHIRNTLWKNDGNFEATFQELRDTAVTNGDPSSVDAFQRFNLMLLEMFETMKLGFRSSHMEPMLHPPLTATRFLAHFDAIFTLNQDTYLEQHYAYQPVHETSHGPLVGIDIPGLKPPAPPVEHGNQLSKAGVRQISDACFSLTPNHQPYIKLHGSYNWRHKSEYLLIVGGNKSSDIARIPLLTWYHQLFREMITKSSVHLMIIGYSFGDTHINDYLFAAARAGAKIFIVDPSGIGTIDKRDRNGLVPNEFRDLFPNLRDSIVGASRRPLRNTLSNDPVELKKLVDFTGIPIKWTYDS